MIPIRSVLFSMLFVISVSQSGFAQQTPQEVLAAQRERIQVIERISKSTIAVFGPNDSAGGGSAVVITSDGFALTNFHVTKPVGSHLKCGMDDGELYDAVIVGVDPTGDVALIKLLGRDDFQPAELGDSDKVRVGDWCYVTGNPFLLATDFTPTISYGIVSGVHRYQYPSGTLLEYADCIQTDAAINPGNSGGPLWNSEGQLVGINGRGSFEKRGRVNVGVGYAISINQIKNFMGHLRSGRVVDHATLGATVATNDSGSVVVSNILSGSDAYRRGLRYGDQIVAFGGRVISSTNGFKNALGIFPKGWRVPLSFQRNGERVDTLVRLSGVHAKEELLAKMELGGISPPAPRRPRAPQENPDRKSPSPEQEPNPDSPDKHHDTSRRSDSNEEKLPPVIANVFAKRRGYANFHFNNVERERVWQAFLKNCNLTGNDATWMLRGSINGAIPFEIAVGDRLAAGRIDGLFQEVDFDLELQTQLLPRKSGGLLLALHQWRRFLVQGPGRFGDVYYHGRSPVFHMDDFYGFANELVATYDVVENRMYFDPKSGRLLAIEMFPDVEVDPCEIYFREYGDRDGRLLPTTLEVRFGDEQFGSIELKEIRFQSSNVPETEPGGDSS